MALYINGQRFKVYIGSNKTAYDLKLASNASNIIGPVLLSSEGYVLQDVNGVYLLPADPSNFVDKYMASADNYILTDKHDTYLIINNN